MLRIPLIYPIDIDIEERFTNNPDLEDEGIMFVDGDTINITEVIENCIISTLPIKKDFARKTVGDYVLNACKQKMLKIVIV